MSESLHQNILRHQNKDVLKKYEVLHVLGTGSMGTVSMVKVKDSKIGGTMAAALAVAVAATYQRSLSLFS